MWTAINNYWFQIPGVFCYTKFLMCQVLAIFEEMSRDCAKEVSIDVWKWSKILEPVFQEVFAIGGGGGGVCKCCLSSCTVVFVIIIKYYLITKNMECKTYLSRYGLLVPVIIINDKCTLALDIQEAYLRLKCQVKKHA